MKIKNILISFIVLCGLLCSCSDFLTEDPAHLGTAESYFPTAEGFDGALNACYSALRLTTNEKYLWNSGVDSNCGGQYDQLPTPANPGTSTNFNEYGPMAMSSDNSYITNFWNRHFIAVDRCNRVIAMGPTASLSASVVATKVAEAKTLRAWYYFMLVEQFGAIPFPLEPYTTLQTTAERIPEETIYTQLIADMEEVSASGVLPANPAQYGRVTQATCWMVLSKLYLTRAWKPYAQSSDFANAAKYADKVINESPHKLLNSYAMVFQPGNEKNEEIIFAVMWSSDQALNKWDWTSSATQYGNNWHSKSGHVIENFLGNQRSNYYNRGIRVYQQNFYVLECFGVDTLTNPGKSYIVPPLLEPTQIFPANHSFKIDSRYDVSFRRLTMAEITRNGGRAHGPDKTTPVWLYAAPNTTSGTIVNLTYNPAHVGRNINHWEGTGRDTSLYIPYPCETHLWPAERVMSVPYAVIPRVLWFQDENGPVKKMFTDAYGQDLPTTLWYHNDWIGMHPGMIKFWEPQTAYGDNWGIRDMFLMRVAEAYLIAAEAYYKMGNTATAADRINTVRQRACIHSNPHYMDVSASDVDIDLILDERVRELAMEEYRWMELKRTGKLIERVMRYNWWANNPYSGIEPYLAPHHLLRPLPYSWWSLLSNRDEVLQNPGYQ